MQSDALTREQVLAFLAGRHAGTIEALERLGGGSWSSAWGYLTDDEQLVVRFGTERGWYEADRAAMAFAGPDLPVPEVREIGTAPNGQAYAISVRHHGRFLEDVPAGLATSLAPTLIRLLDALRAAPATDDRVLWHQPGPSTLSWRQWLAAGLVDDPGQVVHGWSAALESEPTLAALAEAVRDRIGALLEACPERRDLVHGDLLHGNVLVSPDAGRVEAVLSWKCSVRGDFLYDTAWCSFWAPWHPGIAAADPVAALFAEPTLRADRAAVGDAAARHHCYELHVGYVHLGWNLWTGDRANLEATARRLGEVFERGPLPLP
ncbi:MAG: aminoglycoside phosphotransferase family protein [Actinomycetota bacterium]|nr:aminoglycoside phosphotransferase family protein [Actinomycetota bacterium]